MTAPRKPTLRRLADAENISVATLIDRAVREHGTVDAAAKALGVDAMSIYRWTRRHGYKVQRISTIVKA